ncbi:unnamed protein product [Brassica oleracea var. botrytis]
MRLSNNIIFKMLTGRSCCYGEAERARGIVKEGLRLHPPAPFLLRTFQEGCKIGSAVGTMVQCFDWKIKGDRVNMEEAVGGMNLTMAHPLNCTPRSSYCCPRSHDARRYYITTGQLALLSRVLKEPFFRWSGLYKQSMFDP